MYFMKLFNCKAEKVYGHCMISLLTILVRFTAADFLYIYVNGDFRVKRVLQQKGPPFSGNLPVSLESNTEVA